MKISFWFNNHHNFNVSGGNQGSRAQALILAYNFLKNLQNRNRPSSLNLPRSRSHWQNHGNLQTGNRNDRQGEFKWIFFPPKTKTL